MSTAAELQAEAQRQARTNLGPYKSACVDCKQPFTFGAKEEGANVYSMAGARDTQIIGMCEGCFDSLCEEVDKQ
jgi:hypothetical protein